MQSRAFEPLCLLRLVEKACKDYFSQYFEFIPSNQTLFKESRGSLGNREMVKKLRKEGFEVGRYKIRSIMKSLGLKAEQRQAYKVTTKRKHSDTVADNLLN
jgi:hypothetical protein